MASLDVLVSASSYGEAFPNVLGEAMGCGVPCVVTDVGDSAYIVGDTGKVVAPDDMIGLAEAVDSLLSLPSSQRLTLGEQARHRIQENFEINHVVSLYESLYQEV
jgi:glycosyltransferase involved in cell wall biosynthesis